MKTLLLLMGLLCTMTLSAEAQQPGKLPRVGYISVSGTPDKPGQYVEAFRKGLRDLGYVKGKTILVEYRYVEGRLDRYSSLAAEFVQLKVDVLVATAGFTAVKQATKTIPIVMVTTADPVATGLIDSLARPGGNVTGLLDSREN